MKNNKKILPLIASLSLIGGPVLALTACDNERDMNNLPTGTINNDYKNRVLFSFKGVNFNKTVEEQFKDTYQQGLNFILKDVQGTLAQQNFYEFFQKLKYTKEQATTAFEKIKDNLGLNILTQKYLTGLNTANSLDKISAEDNNELLFQNQSWHQDGTSIFRYERVPFYQETNPKTKKINDPNKLFLPTELYKDYGTDQKNKDFDEQLATIAKHPDKNFSDDISTLLENNKKWNGSAGDNTKQKIMENDNIVLYQKYLKRFQWWLRFRYQQYYQYEILPELNKTLFIMSYVLNNIVKITTDGNNEPVIEPPTNTSMIRQLQNIINFEKPSNYKVTWNFNVDLNSARKYDVQIKNGGGVDTKWKDMIVNDQNGANLNSEFFKRMASGDSPSINNIDANFGINGFNARTSNDNTSADWVKNNGYYYTNNNNTATFTYTAPIYFLNLIQNLDFSYLLGQDLKNWIIKIDNPDNDIMTRWINSANPSLKTNFSSYIKGGINPTTGKSNSTITQEQKWNIFLEMLYSISTGDKSADNFKNAASNLFPKYIPKNNIYEEGFWKLVKEFYP